MSKMCLAWSCMAALVCCAVSQATGALASNYDGNIYFDYNCRFLNGRWSQWEHTATVRNGKFAGRDDFRKGEQEGCEIDKCWVRWEGEIKDDGQFSITVRENIWSHKSNGINRWSIVGKFSDNKSGRSRTVSWPKSWLSQCRESSIVLVDPSADSLAGKQARAGSTSAPVSTATGETPETPSELADLQTANSTASTAKTAAVAELLSVRNAGIKAMIDANALLSTMEQGGLSGAIEGRIENVAAALKTNSVQTIKDETGLLVQLVLDVDKARQLKSKTAAKPPSDGIAAGQSAAVVDPPGILPPGKRVALAIGNSAYEHVARLPNPANDAADVGAALARLGFTVRTVENQGRNALRDALAEFSNDALGADVAVVYYAGHGMEVDRQNYLIPVDARLETDLRIRFETIPLDDVMAALDGARGLRLVLLDACRNNPFAASMRITTASRSIGRGLSRVEPVVGTLVSFAAKEGTTAADGGARNSPYAAALLAYVEQRGVEVNKLFRLVRDRVLAATGGQQEPYTYGSTPAADIYLKP
jgi:hypothetical protein